MTSDDRPDPEFENRLRSWMQDTRAYERLSAARSTEEGLRRAAGTRRSFLGSPFARALSVGGAILLIAVAVWTGAAVIGPRVGGPDSEHRLPSAVPAQDRTVREGEVPFGDVIAATTLDDALWLLTEHGTLHELDARSGQERGSVDLGDNGCGDLAAAAARVWFRVCPRGPGFTETEIVQVNGPDRTIVGRLTFPLPVGDAPAATPDGLWVVAEPDAGVLVFVDRQTTTVTRRIELGEAVEAVSASGDAVWVSLGDTNVAAEVDLGRGEIAMRVPLDQRPGRVLIDGDSVWVGGRDDGRLWRIDPRTGGLVGSYDLGGVGVNQIASAAGAVWILAGADAIRIDATTGEVTDLIRVTGHSVQAPPQFTGSTRALAPVDGQVWFVPPTGTMRLLSSR